MAEARPAARVASPAGVGLALLLFLVAAAWLAAGAGNADAHGSRRCAPVVVKAPGGGFDSAAVLIVAGKTDCEKSRRLISKALSAARFEDRQIAGWSCSTTARVSSGHVFGASCVLESGPNGEREAVRSTTPRPCPGCKSVRD